MDRTVGRGSLEVNAHLPWGWRHWCPLERMLVRDGRWAAWWCGKLCLGRGVCVVCVLLNSISARGSCHLKAFLYSNQRHPEGKIKKGHGEIFKDEGIRKSWGLFSWVILPPPLPLFKEKKKS